MLFVLVQQSCISERHECAMHVVGQKKRTCFGKYEHSSRLLYILERMFI